MLVLEAVSEKDVNSLLDQGLATIEARCQDKITRIDTHAVILVATLHEGHPIGSPYEAAFVPLSHVDPEHFPEIFAELAKVMIVENRVIPMLACFMGEGWAVDVHKPENLDVTKLSSADVMKVMNDLADAYMKGQRPSEHADRKEVISILVESIDGKAAGGMLEIKRDAEHNMVLGERHIQYYPVDHNYIQGRMLVAFFKQVREIIDKL